FYFHQFFPSFAPADIVLPVGEAAVFSSSAGFFDQIVAKIGPEILCQIAPQTLGSAASGLKCAVARATPRPEFCMPTSSEIALLSVSFKPMAFAVIYPSSNPNPLCRNTAAKTINPALMTFAALAAVT